MSPGRNPRRGLDARDLERILDVTRDLARPLDLDEALAQVLDAGRAVLGAERGTVFLYDDDNKELFTRAATGVDAIRVPADRGIVGECARTREIVNVPDCYGDPRFNPDVDRKTGYRTRCLLSVPLVGYDGDLVGVLQLLNKTGGIFDATDEAIATALAAQCAVALERARMTEQLILKEKLDRELAVAREIQTGFLPRVMPAVPGYDLACYSRPADETGGDTFDVVSLAHGGAFILLGDATGHGVGPALSVTQVRAMLRIGLRLGADLDTIFRHVNDQLEQDLASNRFVTAFLGVLDPTSHRVLYHSGGQGPLLHFHAGSGDCDFVGATTFPMGMMPQFSLDEPKAFDLEPGDILALITDGVYEYENPDQAMFGKDRVAEIVRRHRDLAMSDLIGAMLTSLEAWAEGARQSDDMTLVLVRRLP